MEQEIRLAACEARLLDDCIDLFIDVFNGPPWNDQWTRERAAQWLSRLFSGPDGRGFCAFMGDRLVAAALGRLEMWWRGEEFHIEEMFVARDGQGRGIGSRLLAHIEAEMRKEGVAAVTLATGRDRPARRFYEKNGYYCVDNLVFMKKKLFG